MKSLRELQELFPNNSIDFIEEQGKKSKPLVLAIPLQATEELFEIVVGELVAEVGKFGCEIIDPVGRLRGRGLHGK